MRSAARIRRRARKASGAYPAPPSTSSATIVANTPAAKENIGIASTLITKPSSCATRPEPNTTKLPVTCAT